MNIKSLLEGFDRIYDEAREKEPINEASEAMHQLTKSLYDTLHELQRKNENNIKTYEHAFQDVIEKHFPEHLWWQVTDCDIFWSLFNDRDPEKTIIEIVKGIKPEFKEEKVEESFIEEKYGPIDTSTLEPRKRYALDGEVWWVPYDTEAKDWNRIPLLGKYKTEKECQYAIDHINQKYGFNESVELNEGASNFWTMKNFPLLIFDDYDYVYDRVYDQTKEELGDELEDVEDENEYIIESPKFDEIWKKYFDYCTLTDEEQLNLQEDIDEFNRNMEAMRHEKEDEDDTDYEVAKIEIKPGYYEAAQLFVPDEKYLEQWQIDEINKFFKELKGNYYLTEMRKAWQASNGEAGYEKVNEDIEEVEDDEFDDISDEEYYAELEKHIAEIPSYDLKKLKDEYREFRNSTHEDDKRVEKALRVELIKRKALKEALAESVSDCKTMASHDENKAVGECKLTERGLTKAKRHNRNTERIFASKRVQDKKYADFLKGKGYTDEQINKLADDDALSKEIADKFTPKGKQPSEILGKILGESTVSEDVRKEWKPNTKFNHIKDVLTKALERGKYIDNEREEVFAAMNIADKGGYTPEQRRFIRDKHREMWQKGRKTNESAGQDVTEYQKWVDYDMKKYHRISDDTMSKIRKAGLSVVKDQYGDYEVIAYRPIKESAPSNSKFTKGDRAYTLFASFDGGKKGLYEPVIIKDVWTDGDFGTQYAYEKRNGDLVKSCPEKFLLNKRELESEIKSGSKLVTIEESTNLKESRNRLKVGDDVYIVRKNNRPRITGKITSFYKDKVTVSDGRGASYVAEKSTVFPLLDESRGNYGHEGPFWYFTTHGIGPGTVPKDVALVKVKAGTNKKGTQGTFIALDGVLTAEELKEYDLIELAPTDNFDESQSTDLLNAVKWMYGYSTKKAREWIKSADENTKKEVLKGFAQNAKKSFLTDSLSHKKKVNESMLFQPMTKEEAKDFYDRVKASTAKSDSSVKTALNNLYRFTEGFTKDYGKKLKKSVQKPKHITNEALGDEIKVYMNTWANYNENGADLSRYGIESIADGWLTVDEAIEFAEEHAEDEPFINDIENAPYEVSEYDNAITVLNDFKEIEESDVDMDIVSAIIEATGYDVHEAMDIAERGDYYFYPDVDNDTDLAHAVIDEIGSLGDALGDKITSYIDEQAMRDDYEYDVRNMMYDDAEDNVEMDVDQVDEEEFNKLPTTVDVEDIEYLVNDANDYTEEELRRGAEAYLEDIVSDTVSDPENVEISDFNVKADGDKATISDIVYKADVFDKDTAIEDWIDENINSYLDSIVDEEIAMAERGERDLSDYFDYEAFGRDLRFDGYTYTDKGAILVM